MNYPESAQLSGRAVTLVDRFTYLGNVLHRDMTDDADIRKQTTKLTVTANTLLRKFSTCSLEVKLGLFRSLCYSLYCNSLWSQFKVVTINRLRLCHKDVLKKLLRLPRWISSSLAFTRNGVNRLGVIRRHSVFSMKNEE